MKPYSIRVFFSEEDQGFIAEVPALHGCTAFGETPEQAVRDLEVAQNAMLEVMKEHGDPIPDPAVVANQLRSLDSILNVSEIARKAGLNQHTLASKLRRKTPLTPDEARRIRDVFVSVGGNVLDAMFKAIVPPAEVQGIVSSPSDGASLRPQPSARNNYTVVRRKDGAWSVKKESSVRALSVHSSQADAVRAAKDRLRRRNGGELVTLGRDGSVRSKDTIPPARELTRNSKR